jgi:hypothetical protein
MCRECKHKGLKSRTPVRKIADNAAGGNTLIVPQKGRADHGGKILIRLVVQFQEYRVTYL